MKSIKNDFVNRIKRYRLRASNATFGWIFIQIIKRIIFLFCFLILLPLTLILHSLGFRRLNVKTSKIGHLAAEVDCFLKLFHMGHVDKNKKYFISCNYKKISNKKLLQIWSKSIYINTNFFINLVLDYMTFGPFMKYDVTDYVLSTAKSSMYYQVNIDWAKRPSIASLDYETIKSGNSVLKKLGIPEWSWYVCVHARENDESFADNEVHHYRNCSIDTFVDAIGEIKKRGGYCLMMGSRKLKINYNIDGLINYSSSEFANDELDIFLCATCKFFLGNTSGLFLASSIFHVPVIQTNTIPLTGLPFRIGDFAIFKELYDENSRELTYKEILKSDIVDFRYSSIYDKYKLIIKDNNSVDIQNVVIEMLEFLDGKNIFTDEYFILLNKFKSMIKTNHYCYNFETYISPKFLKNKSYLLS